LRLSFGGIGGYLVNKFVKQTKIDSWFAHEGSLNQGGPVEAEPDERARGARVLGEADAAVWKEVPRLDSPYSVIDECCKFLVLFVRNRSAQILDFNQPLTHENNLGNFVDAGHPRIADKLRIER